jgi:hypothetical protein
MYYFYELKIIVVFITRNREQAHNGLGQLYKNTVNQSASTTSTIVKSLVVVS